MIRRILLASVLMGFIVALVGCSGSQVVAPPKVSESFKQKTQESGKTQKAE